MAFKAGHKPWNKSWKNNECPKCSFEGCNKPAHARGWCGTHYARWRKHGDPSVIPPRKGKKYGTPWNKGLTVDDSRVAASVEKLIEGRRAKARLTPPHPMAHKACVAVNGRLRSNPKWKPSECQECGKKPDSSRELHAHHYLGYERAHWFDIVWLCTSCHATRHKEVV